MFRSVETGRRTPLPREGELFKVIHLYGKRFEIRYGFYEDQDRYARSAEPVAIYPNFTVSPQYTEDGLPFVTAMQSPCGCFGGKRNEDSCCGDCIHYRHGEELLGACMHPEHRIIPGGESAT